jgi:hypothetical protein
MVVLAILQGVQTDTSAQEPELAATFTATDASADFPAGITFSVEFETDEPIARAELFYTSDGDESLRLVTVPVTDPAVRSLSYFLDLRIYYYPPGIDMVFQWRLTGENGLTVQSQQSRAPWIDDRFEWQFLETDDVQVATYKGGEEFTQSILDSAQHAIDQIQADLGAELDQQVRIWAYATNDDFGGTKAPNSEQWSVGVAYPSLKVILAVLPPGDAAETGRVVPHEISHQVISQAIHNPFNRLPTWLDEGIAVSYQENGNSHFPAMVQQAADDGVLFSIMALNASFPYDGNQATLGYAQSFSIVNFIRETWGEDGLAELVAVYRQGVSHDEAAMHALGVDLAELDRLWKESLGYQGDRGIGSTSEDNDRGGGFLGELLASGALIWVLIAMLAIGVGLRSILVTGRRPDDVDDSSALKTTVHS